MVELKPRLAWMAAGLLLLAPALAPAQSVPVDFHWSAPRTGAPVIFYRVYQVEDDGAAVFVGTEPDTTYRLVASQGVRYRVQVAGVDFLNREGPRSALSEVVYFEIPQTQTQIPLGPALRPNYPNPFNPQTTIAYGVPTSAEGAPIALDVYDLRGQRVRRLPVNPVPGWHEVVWDGADERGVVQASGQYVVRLACGGEVKTWKMTMLK